MMLSFAIVAIAAPAMAQTPAEIAIRKGMEASAAGWNAGDLARFMDIYADDAVFVTPKGLLRGKPAIADKYRLQLQRHGQCARQAVVRVPGDARSGSGACDAVRTVDADSGRRPANRA